MKSLVESLNESFGMRAGVAMASAVAAASKKAGHSGLSDKVSPIEQIMKARLGEVANDQIMFFNGKKQKGWIGFDAAHRLKGDDLDQMNLSKDSTANELVKSLASQFPFKSSGGFFSDAKVDDYVLKQGNKYIIPVYVEADGSSKFEGTPISQNNTMHAVIVPLDDKKNVKKVGNLPATRFEYDGNNIVYFNDGISSEPMSIRDINGYSRDWKTKDMKW